MRNVVVEIEGLDPVKNGRRSREERLILFDGSELVRVVVVVFRGWRKLEMRFVRRSEGREVDGFKTVNNGRRALDLRLVWIVGFGRERRGNGNCTNH